MPDRSRFDLRRRSDGLVYRFHLAERADGARGYRREDGSVWIVHSPTRGWVVVDEQTGAVTGKPWDPPPHEQPDHPPEGEWVSKKGDKSYVYELTYPK